VRAVEAAVRVDRLREICARTVEAGKRHWLVSGALEAICPREPVRAGARLGGSAASASCTDPVLMLVETSTRMSSPVPPTALVMA
jgi:hypothetical protein